MVIMRHHGRAPGRSAGLLFCGVALQILLALLCDAVGAAERDANSLSDEDANLQPTIAYRGSRPFPLDHPPLMIGRAYGNWNDDGALVSMTIGLRGMSLITLLAPYAFAAPSGI